MPTTDSRWQLEQLYTVNEIKQIVKTFEKQLDQLDEARLSLRSQVSLFEGLMAQAEELSDFIYCLYAEDVSRAEIADLLDQAERIQARLKGSETLLEKRLRHVPEAEWEALTKITSFYYLTERCEIAKRRLSAEQEQLIQNLGIDGFSAWEQLYEQRLIGLRIPLERGAVTIGEAMYQAVNGLTREDRQTAAEAVEALCVSESDDFAFLLNRIAGYRLQVYAKRGWSDVIMEMCEQNRIQRKTIEAMLTAIDQDRPLFQSYYARKLVVAQIKEPSWHDLESTSFTSDRHVPYETAQAVILKQFNRLDSGLADFTKHVFEAGWVDAENRPGKAEGGFCASFPVQKESRIFMTYRQAYQDVVTLAHELGHAYHNSLLYDLPFLDQIKGTSVAETASTFMENLVLDAVIEQSQQEEKVALLEIKIQEGLKYAGVIPNLFRFEQRFYAERQHGPVSGTRMTELMQEEEADLYGELIRSTAPFKWVYIGHLYSTDKPFYNIPYTVGYLLSNRLYMSVKQSKSAFVCQFEPLLRDSGQATIEELIERHLGEDPQSVEFWKQSLTPLRESISLYMNETDSLIPVD